MLSNLTVRSNVIENCSTPEAYRISGRGELAPLARISARDLHEWCELNPVIYYFDRRNMSAQPHGLPTPEQKEQWESYLFHGDKTVSLAQDDRLTHCWVSTAEYLLRNWEKIRADLDIERAVESLCILFALEEDFRANVLTTRDFSAQELQELRDVRKVVEDFLQDKHLGQFETYQRVRQILGLPD